MKDVNVKEEYNKLKYKLPKFEELNNDFEIDFIKEKIFLIRQVRRKINEKVIFFCRIIEGLLYPTQQHIINVTEIKNFSDEKKKEIEKIYKKLMVYERQSLLLDVYPDDKKDAEFINDVFNFWKKIKKEMEEVVVLMKETWKKEFSQEKNNYFG
ncbi:hypothetical protein J4446_01855 [Candidatus Woesearchaeota archaeon]|nr:hypothetical protein [Candidatus Woesearchaeota archaeon]